jgi:hypothetical protein
VSVKPLRYKSILGSSFLNSLQEPILVIGRNSYSKHQLATELGVAHLQAARLLSKAAKRFGARSIKDLYRKCTPEMLAQPQHHCGVTTIYVMLAAFAAEGLDIDVWYGHNQPKSGVVTYQTLKQRKTRERKQKGV